MPELRNKNIVMALDEAGRLTTLASIDGAVKIPIDPAGLTAAFEIQLRTEAGEVIVVTPQTPPAIRAQSDRIRLDWTVKASWGQLDVTGLIALPAEAMASEWTLKVRNRTPHAVWQAAFPRVSGLTSFQGYPGSDWLAVPFQMGFKEPDPVTLVNHAERVKPTWARNEYGCFDVEGGKADIAFSYPGMWTLQFMAYGHPACGGMYFGAHDGQALYKRFGMYADGGTGRHAALVLKQYPKDRTASGANFTSFYPAMVGIYRGDWWGASAIYRAWALKQKWAQRGPTRNRADIPAWAKQLDLWYWNWQYLTAHPFRMIPAILYLKQRFGCEMGFHWYGSNGQTHCGFLPEVAPDNRDMLNLLLKAVRALHQAKVHCIPYIQGRRWNPDTESFRKANGMEWIAVDEHGKPSEALNNFRHTMCPTAVCHHNIVRKATLRVMDRCEMDGAYLDVISSCFSVPCFNPKHNHPPGGHDHWRRGYRTNLAKVQKAVKARSPEAIITSESVIECFLDLLDLDLAREISHMGGPMGNIYCQPIPLFHSVYHDYHMTYGTVTTFGEKDAAKFRYAETLTLVGGGQLMISGFFTGDQNRETYRPYLAFMETLTRAHMAGRRWFNLGVWKPPVAVACDMVQVEKRGGDSPVQLSVPSVLAGCFELEGELCVALVNHTDQARKASFRLAASEYGLSGREFSLAELHPDPQTRENKIDGGLLDVASDLAPASVKIIRIRAVR